VGFTTAQNVTNALFNGIGGRKKGVWQVDCVLSTEYTVAPVSSLIWTTVSGTSDALTTTCAHGEIGSSFGGINVQIIRLSFILEVTTIPTTYYLNFKKSGGAGLVANISNSQIMFTRIG
jgi:hypothetical protein